MKNGLTLSVGVAMVMIVSINTAFAGGPSYARNITAYIHFNEEAIKEDRGGGELDDAWWTVDGKNVTSGYYDMSDAVYGDSSEPDVTDRYSDELMVSDNASKICFEEYSEDPDYKACGYIYPDQTAFHVTYPASWQPENED